MAKGKNTGTPAVGVPENSIPSGFWARLTEDAWANLIGGILIAGVLLWVGVFHGGKPVSPVYAWTHAGELFAKVLKLDNLVIVAASGMVFAVLSAIAVKLSGGNLWKYLAGFSIVFLLAVLSLVVAGNSGVEAYGLEYVVFALLSGLLLNNLFQLPEWLKAAARSEFFIKTGLIILGTSILFPNIVQAGFPGILQALAVVSVVWFFSLWLSRRLKVDDEFGVILASAVSICGVSAAIVASGAIQGDKKKLSYVTTLVLLLAIPMMVLQPWAIQAFGIPEIVGGAWLGGTLDTTATVVAATEQVGPAASKVGAIVKLSQNVLLGFAAFFIATWWIFRKKPEAGTGSEKPNLKLIWERFPKFVLGFIVVSLIFSFLIPTETVKQTSGFLNSLRTLWFALAFVAIGLEARFSDLLKTQGGRPALVFTGAQLFNIFWTLLWSYLLFGGVVLAIPDIK
ncbi:MAG: putative sulfate exporter family transporter [Saprospiraceae bacterium]|nr:putative sulfate exporter family transporter [Saprospiraceae bacterium]